MGGGGESEGELICLIREIRNYLMSMTQDGIYVKRTDRQTGGSVI